MSNLPGGARVVESHEGALSDVDKSEWVERLARVGYAAKGVVYLLVGLLAAQAAFGTGGQTTGTQGALREIVKAPFGQLLLVLIALGLASYVLWRFVQAIRDPGNKGSDVKGLLQRAGYLASGLAYAGLSLTAIQMVVGSSGGSGSGQSAEDWTARLLALPFGTWLVGLAGLVAIGVGLAEFYRAYQADFHLKREEMSETEETWVTRLGRVGLVARGIVYGLIGLFLIQAARQYDPSEAGGLGEALSTLAAQPYGPWLLGIVALGLAAYGLYSIARSRYRRIHAR